MAYTIEKPLKPKKVVKTPSSEAMREAFLAWTPENDKKMRAKRQTTKKVVKRKK